MGGRQSSAAQRASSETEQKSEQAKWESVWDTDTSVACETTTLSEDRAWAIATAWRDQLLGCNQWHKRVRLKTDSMESGDDDLAIVQRYEWIKIKLSSDDDAAIARAAATAWFWLSCCEGYSGRENPQFWKRVFSELQRHTDGPRIADRRPPRTDASITDAIRFFDRPGREFPRIRLKATYDASVYQVFLGTRVAPADAMRDHKLRSISAYLRPFLVAKRLDRALDVAVEKLGRQAIEPPLPAAAAEVVAPMRVGSTTAAAVSPEHLPESPRFLVHSLLVHRRSLQPDTKANTAWLTENDDAHVKRVTCSAPPDRYPTGEMATQLRTLFLLDEQNGRERATARVRSLQLFRESLPPQLLASVCSALPHAQRVSTLHITTPQQHRGYPHRNRHGTPPYRAFSLVDWAWIGYAVFHPDASSSTWCSLDVAVDDLTPDAVQILQVMAAGNNLHRFIDMADGYSSSLPSPSAAAPTDPPSVFYYATRLHETTELREGASLTAAASVIGMLPPHCSVCLLGADVTRHGDWVRVIAPGYGIGWIRWSATTDIVARPPGTPGLRGLRLQHREHPTQTRAVIDLIKTIGTRVERLDALACGDLDAATLSDLLASCPALQTLRVVHDGSLWSSHECPSENQPRLQELSLQLLNSNFYAPSTTALRAMLCDLTVLKVITNGRRGSFEMHRKTVRKLLKMHPTLQYFHWRGRCGRYDGRVANAYTDGRADTLHVLGKASASVLECSLPLGVASRVALLSVVYNTRDTTPASPLARVDRDLLEEIFSFASSSGSRDLWIQSLPQLLPPI